jgi:hypothetical protein
MQGYGCATFEPVDRVTVRGRTVAEGQKSSSWLARVVWRAGRAVRLCRRAPRGRMLGVERYGRP